MVDPFRTPTSYNFGFLWMICLVAAMGGLLFGYDWVVIGGAKAFYEPYFRLTGEPFWQGFAMSAALFGCILGAAICGALSDRFGRRRLLLLAGFLFTVSAVWTALAGSFVEFNAARFIGGVGIGLASNLSPMYIAEVSPANMRGRFVSINQLTIVIGILAAQVTNLMIAQPAGGAASADLIRQSWNGLYGWRWMFGAEAFPAAMFFWLMFFVPESPRWLVKRGRDEQARAILARVGGRDYADFAVADIQDTVAREATSRADFRELFQAKVIRIVALGMFLAVFQQWCGINVIFNYAQEVFQAAGYAVDDLMFSIVITGMVNLAFTVVAFLTVDRFGRRPLMLIGAAGLAGIYALLGCGYYLRSQGVHMLFLVVSAIACYAMSLAPVTWVVISEIFPNRIRGAAMSLAVLSLWTACTALTFTFPLLNRQLGPHGAFWLYGAICVVGWIGIWKNLPETKGKSLEDIQRELLS